MRKRFILVITTLLFLIMIITVPTSAGTDKIYFKDTTGNVSQEDSNRLNKELKELSDKYNCDIVFSITDSYENKPGIQHAEDYYKEGKFGRGEFGDGMIMEVNFKERTYYLGKHKYPEYAFNEDDSEIRNIIDKTFADMEEIGYAEGVETWISLCDEKFAKEKNVYIRDYTETSVIADEDLVELNKKLKNISKKHGCDVVICLTDSFGDKTPNEWADDYFDYARYGQGENYDGIALVIDTNSRQWAISTSGKCEHAVKESMQEDMMDEIASELHDDNYTEAFYKFTNVCDDQLEVALKKTINHMLIDIIVGIVAGFIIAFAIMTYRKRQLKTVRHEPKAANYLKKGSMNLRSKNDYFLYSHIDKRKIDRDTHTSSSGRSHGGSSGRF